MITTVCHTGSSKPGRACVHRARFLEGLIDLIPPSTALFGKSLKSISEADSTGKLLLRFSDGSTADANVIIACDGIKSIARQTYVLSSPEDQEVSCPVFTGDVAYRGMFPRSKFLEIVGDTINAGKGTLFCGPASYAVMYPVEQGSMMNVVAIKHISPSDPKSAPQTEKDTSWIENVSHQTMMSDFESWGAPIKALLSQIGKPQRWALYDHLPASTYVRGRVALMGDAAHATTPHQGQGAGMAFEDSLILSGILGHVWGEEGSVHGDQMDAKVQACLHAYDVVRRSRTQKVTATSREMGQIIGFAGEGIGRDLGRLKGNLDSRMDWIWNVDLAGEISRGIEIVDKLGRLLKVEQL